ncbi:iron chelate uptake ABC transporter family permease subunit [Aerococcaceae bacterium DSM 111176]|nr:iron chelate uptake ABC transporter family permease subunit [Aerococcaceae bacterium DSM 111176]
MRKIKEMAHHNHIVLNKQLLFLFFVALGVVLFFLFYRLDTAISIILPLRMNRVIALILVGVNLSLSTILFQGVTHNNILTPNIMGFEAIYSLIVTIIILMFSKFNMPQPDRLIVFIIQLIIMVLVSVNLFIYIFKKTDNNLFLLLLTGLVIGTLLRSFNSMLTTVMDPDQFMAVQDAKTASFNLIDKQSLILTAIISVISWISIFFKRHDLDIVSLGEEQAINLGLNYQQIVRFSLINTAVLVACSTALVGPLTFFGLLSAQITAYYLKSNIFKYYLLASSLMGIILLIGGQSILEHLLNQATILPVVIEIVGGCLLLWLIKKGVKK